MKTEKINLTRRLVFTVAITAILLSIPLIAMQFTDEVKWDLTDFVIMGILLLTTGFTIEMVTRKAKSTGLKIILTLIILLVLFLIWAELAVGIFGTPFAGS